MALGIVPRIRRAAKILLLGAEDRFHEDEKIGFNLKPLRPVPDTVTRVPRLNIITPSLSASAAFGGLSTLIGLPLEIFQSGGLAAQGWKLRVICLREPPASNDNIATKFVTRLGIDPAHVSIHYGSGRGEPVPTAADDRFLGSLWHSQISAMPLMRFQHKHFSRPRLPYISLVQDYEAGFHPWSSAYMLAHASYEADWPKRIIFNSEELAAFYREKGHPFEDSYTFEPNMNVSLREALAISPRPDKERRILFYGRPNARRNCFFLARRALELWAESYEGAREWTVVSVGADYAPFSLKHGVSVEILGKLTLQRYADELHRAAVGLSLMASPHPSYPPLEMAHFGALTVCNNFEHKNLRKWHDNLMPVDIPDPEHIAEALAHACHKFEASPGTARQTLGRKPHYLKGMDEAELQKMAALIAR